SSTLTVIFFPSTSTFVIVPLISSASTAPTQSTTTTANVPNNLRNIGATPRLCYEPFRSVAAGTVPATEVLAATGLPRLAGKHGPLVQTRGRPKGFAILTMRVKADGNRSHRRTARVGGVIVKPEGANR